MCRWSLQNIQRENCWEGFKFPPGAYSCRVRIVVKILNVPEYFRHRMLVASDFVSFLRSFARHGILIFLIRVIPKILSDEFVLEIFWSVLLDRLCICYNILIDSEIGRNYIRLRVKFLLHNIIKNHGTRFANLTENRVEKWSVRMHIFTRSDVLFLKLDIFLFSVGLWAR